MPDQASPHVVRGIIAALPTPLDEMGAANLPVFVHLARHMLDHGCDGLNVLGTMGEAMSFGVSERERIMAAAAASLPRERLTVGTGATSVTDAVRLTRMAATLGFGGALILPPFYYRGVTARGIFAYMSAIIAGTAERPIPLYLYHYPALTGVPWSLDLIQELLQRFPNRIVGIKDASGDVEFARAAALISETLRVYPTNEALLMEARNGRFAGIMSSTVGLNADLCVQAWDHGDENALAKALKIRKLLDGMNAVAGVKAMLAHMHQMPDLAWVRPPLIALSPEEGANLHKAAMAIRLESTHVFGEHAPVAFHKDPEAQLETQAGARRPSRHH
jgi:4-hydroxy-tetrahydrodipicolinate synthase